MKKLLLYICSILISHYSFSKCEDYQISFSKTDSMRLKDVREKFDLNMNVKFDENKYKNAYIEICQVVGMRTLSRNNFEINKSTSVKFPVISFPNSSTEQYLIIRLSDKPRSENESFFQGSKCIDSIRISDSYVNEEHFWKKGVSIDYKVFVNNIPVDTLTDKINIKITNADFVSKSKVFVTNDFFNATFKISLDKTSCEFNIFSTPKSNQEYLEILIYPNAFKEIREKTGLRFFNQFENLSTEERIKYKKMFPEYALVFDTSVTFKSFTMYNTDHIILYKLSNSSGVHYIGADCANSVE